MATLDANLHGSFEDCTRQNFGDVSDKLNMWFMSHHLKYLCEVRFHVVPEGGCFITGMLWIRYSPGVI